MIYVLRINMYFLIFQQKRFSSGVGLVLTCLGSAVGTGNIWRFPRIVATHAAGGGMHVASTVCAHVNFCIHYTMWHLYLMVFVFNK